MVDLCQESHLDSWCTHLLYVLVREQCKTNLMLEQACGVLKRLISQYQLQDSTVHIDIITLGAAMG